MTEYEMKREREEQRLCCVCTCVLVVIRCSETQRHKEMGLEKKGSHDGEPLRRLQCCKRDKQSASIKAFLSTFLRDLPKVPSHTQELRPE